jgi:virginiamycin B lyase
MEGHVAEFAVPGVSTPFGICAGPDGNVWFADTGDRIGRMTPRGQLELFEAPAGASPNWIARGPDRSLWFSEVGKGMIGRIAAP